MFVYLDESGDTGIKFQKASSTFFVITLLVVVDPLPIHNAINEFRYELGYDLRPEFKFTSSKPAVRERFLRTIQNHDFSVRAVVVDKQLLVNDPGLRTRQAFYNYLVRMILEIPDSLVQRATLVLDESVTSRRVQGEMGTYLRRELNRDGHQRITKIQHRDSKRDNLIQAVDMISGAIYACYHRQEPHYYHIIRRRIDFLWEYPPGTK
jgi:hypothetical protein